MQLPDRVLRTVSEHRMFAPGHKVLVAVSGGQDSVALLHVLCGLRQQLGISIAAGHLDHGFRGPESAADADYVRTLCTGLDVTCLTGYEDVPALKKSLRLSAQEAARRIRRGFLLAAADTCGADRIAIGHTRDDRVETMLLNILRGTGPDGLRGFPPVSLPLVRPLFDALRADTSAYCSANGLEPRSDPSNSSLVYRRNRIRHETLPYLAEQFNANIADALVRLSDLAADESELLDTLAKSALLEAVGEPRADRISISLDVLIAQPPALRRRMLRLAVLQVRGDLHGVEHRAIDDALRHASHRESFTIQLPVSNGRRAFISGGSETLDVRLQGAYAREVGPAEEWSVLLPLDGIVETPDGTVHVRSFASVMEAREALLRAQDAGLLAGGAAGALIVRVGEVRLPLTARSWRAGDRMRPRGMRGTKKLQDIFVDRKLPAARRILAPVIVEAGETSEGSAGPRADNERSGRILGILGVQASEFAVKVVSSPDRGEKSEACLLIMALSPTGAT